MLPALLSIPSKISAALTNLTGQITTLSTLVNTRSTLTQAQAATGVWANATRTLTSAPSVIKSVQRGTIQVTNNTQAWVMITAVNPAKTFVVSSISGPWDTDANSRIRITLTGDGLSVRADRTGTNYSSGIVSFEVVEFY